MDDIRTDQQRDEQALVAAACEDPREFGPLYERYLTPLYRYILLRTGDPEAAADLTATTFSKALAGLGRYSGKGSFAAWLFGIARHTVQDYYRQQRPSLDLDAVAAWIPDPAPSPEARMLSAEQGRALRRLVQRLPASQQEALALYFFAELRVAEVAAVLGRSEGSVRMLVHRAIGTLRDQYRQEE
jgi:RNA polymerase sigma-70 factor, ECF subfamily